MRRSFLPIILLATGLLAGGSPAHAGDLGVYLRDRGNDILDIFRLRGGVPENGQAIGAKARVTSLAQVGYVHFEGNYAGLEKRGTGVVNEERTEGGISVLYGSNNKTTAVEGNKYLMGETDWHEVEDRRIVRNLPHWDDGRQSHLSIGGEIATPLVALDAGVYPEEALDAALGIFAIDYLNDDELGGHQVAFRKATTPPVPKMDAPFANKRREFLELQAEWIINQLEAEGQLDKVLGSSPALEEKTIAPPPPPPAAPQQEMISEGSILKEDADAAIELLENKEQEAEKATAVTTEVPPPPPAPPTPADKESTPPVEEPPAEE